jgi:DNA repair protein RecO (recombination protein O)
VENAHGILIRRTLLSNTSLIVHWLTREHGIVRTAAKGARRPGSPFTGKLDLFYSADFSFVRSRRSDLHTLRELAVLRRGLDWLDANDPTLRAVLFYEREVASELGIHGEPGVTPAGAILATFQRLPDSRAALLRRLGGT